MIYINNYPNGIGFDVVILDGDPNDLPLERRKERTIYLSPLNNGSYAEYLWIAQTEQAGVTKHKWE